jgi:hypothetical protein
MPTPTLFATFYVLFARAEENVGAYVGSTNDPHRRMQDHLLNARDPIIPRSSSSDLVMWAKRRKAPIQVAFLEAGYFSFTDRTAIEGAWAAAVRSVGFELPGVRRWGNMSRGQFARSMRRIVPHLETFPTLASLFRAEPDAALETPMHRALSQVLLSGDGEAQTVW